jgi:hypothetical protein
MALRRRKPTAGLTHHSDRGVQGGFNRWSQHFGQGGCDEVEESSIASMYTN